MKIQKLTEQSDTSEKSSRQKFFFLPLFRLPDRLRGCTTAENRASTRDKRIPMVWLKLTERFNQSHSEFPPFLVVLEVSLRYCIERIPFISLTAMQKTAKTARKLQKYEADETIIEWRGSKMTPGNHSGFICPGFLLFCLPSLTMTVVSRRHQPVTTAENDSTAV